MKVTPLEPLAGMSATALRRLVFGVTIARLPLALGFFFCSYFSNGQARSTMVALCVLVEVSDVLDGYLARRLGVVTPLGAMADSTVDHVARTTEAVALVAVGVFPASLLVVMIGRDAVVATVRQLSLRRSGVGAGTRRSGKIKGIAQGFCIVTLTSYYALASHPTAAWLMLSSVVVTAAFLATAVSLVDYSVAYWRSARPLRLETQATAPGL
ncbi:CDP-diacylglycerol--glycerol-3-phosphate 3-phosphatidyltransferase [Mycobacterium simulans]|uniref:CDP-alcohol phosphatidyltransferase family protein n=1 Tax=Mycobacterium simulans TaxID=627089 RepID=UPI00174BB59E|nr:CDP-alcohol phosphatidyltransferase family protein [Mycobacterium simulans]SON60905.1 CDP-diacylglycerol--glycerol-3-phosphate 3-phosphatidyltransferase [Mycobacterium simulans]